MSFAIGTAVEIFEADGQSCGRGVVSEIDECANSFNVRYDEYLMGSVNGFDLKTGRETQFTDGIEDSAKTLMFGRYCREVKC